MQVEAIPTMIAQYRETFEGGVGPTWITDAGKDSGVLGFIDTLSAEQALAAPVPGARSVAEHVTHLLFALQWTLERMRGKDPPAEWASSFNLREGTWAEWERLKRELRQTYDALLAEVEKRRDIPVAEWPGIYLAGLAATIAHNAYHLGAIRQIGRMVQKV